MKAKQIILAGLMSLSLAGSALAANLNPYWHMLPEDAGYQKSMNKSANDDLDSIDSFLNTFVGTHNEILEEQKDFSSDKKEGGWKFKGFETSLGMGLSGKIGIIGFGGSKTVALGWKRKSTKKSNELSDDSNAEFGVQINEDSTKQDLYAQIDPVVENLVKTKRVTNGEEARKNLKKAADEFYEYAKGMYTYGDYVWYTSKLRLDLVVGASGKVSPFFVKVGAEVRVRLEWGRIMEKANSDKGLREWRARRAARRAERRAKRTAFAKDTAGLMTALAQDFTKSLEGKKSAQYGFALKEIKVCLAMSAEGKILVAKVKGKVGPCVYFKRHRTKMADKANLVVDKDATINAGASNSDRLFDYANKTGITYKKGLKSSVFKINRKRFRKGIHKAHKFGMKFAKKVTKRRYKRSKWGIQYIKAAYKLSISGSVGPAKLAVEPEMEMKFVNLAM
jgi:hypothetical protein